MEDTNLEVIEINGIKMEIDLRTARRVDTLKVGSKVKILTKGSHPENAVYPGVIVGFEQFQSLPTIIVCYLKTDYLGCVIKFAYINTASSDKYEMVATVDNELPVAKGDVLSRMDKSIEAKKAEVEDLERKRAYFLSHFNQYFESEVA